MPPRKSNQSSKGKTTQRQNDDKEPEKRKALEQVLTQIERNFGKGAIMRLGDASQMRVATVPSGALPLDLALGGGYPKGRIVEIFGPESSGKTSIALHAIAEVQKIGGTVAFVDAEHALDPTYAAALGVQIEDLLVSQPDTGEDALEIVDQLVRSAAVDVVVVDSVAALVPRAEIEGDMGDAHVGLQARLMSQALRKIAGSVSKTGSLVIFLNQLRSKIGGMGYGPQETTTGGNALKFYASVRLDIRRIQTLKKGSEEYGIRARVKVVKNKVAPPFRRAEFDIIFGQGISNIGCIVDLAEELGILKRRGAWYSYNGENVAQGRDNLIVSLKEDSAFLTEIETGVREKLSAGATVSPTSVAPTEETDEEDPEGIEPDMDASEDVVDDVVDDNVSDEDF